MKKVTAFKGCFSVMMGSVIGRTLGIGDYITLGLALFCLLFYILLLWAIAEEFKKPIEKIKKSLKEDNSPPFTNTFLTD